MLLVLWNVSLKVRTDEKPCLLTKKAKGSDDHDHFLVRVSQFWILRISLRVGLFFFGRNFLVQVRSIWRSEEINMIIFQAIWFWKFRSTFVPAVFKNLSCKLGVWLPPPSCLVMEILECPKCLLIRWHCQMISAQHIGAPHVTERGSQRQVIWIQAFGPFE